MNDELLITLIFGAIAAFVIFKLRSVLGRRTGHEPPPNEGAGDFGAHKRSAGNDAGNDNVVSLPDNRTAQGEPVLDPESPAAAGIAHIQALDPQFNAAGFVGGSEGAFQMIVEAYAGGDRETLQQLLGSEVYRSFEAAITDREQAGHSFETHIEKIRGAEIVEAEVDGREARVTVLFVTEQSNATHDASGELVDGDPNTIETISDLWTFARDTGSRDPNWLLVETATPE